MTTDPQYFIPRTILQMSKPIAIARKLKKSGHLAEADETLSNALANTIPEQADLLEMADETTASSLLGEPQAIEAYVELLLERAAIKVSIGQDSKAEDIRRRALRLFMAGLNRNRKISIEGLLIFGKLTGLELQLILSRSEFSQWQKIDQYIQNGTIQVL